MSPPPVVVDRARYTAPPLALKPDKRDMGFTQTAASTEDPQHAGMMYTLYLELSEEGLRWAPAPSDGDAERRVSVVGRLKRNEPQRTSRIMGVLKRLRLFIAERSIISPSGGACPSCSCRRSQNRNPTETPPSCPWLIRPFNGTGLRPAPRGAFCMGYCRTFA